MTAEDVGRELRVSRSHAYALMQTMLHIRMGTAKKAPGASAWSVRFSSNGSGRGPSNRQGRDPWLDPFKASFCISAGCTVRGGSGGVKTVKPSARRSTPPERTVAEARAAKITGERLEQRADPFHEAKERATFADACDLFKARLRAGSKSGCHRGDVRTEDRSLARLPSRGTRRGRPAASGSAPGLHLHRGRSVLSRTPRRAPEDEEANMRRVLRVHDGERGVRDARSKHALHVAQGMDRDLARVEDVRALEPAPGSREARNAETGLGVSTVERTHACALVGRDRKALGNARAGTARGDRVHDCHRRASRGGVPFSAW